MTFSTKHLFAVAALGLSLGAGTLQAQELQFSQYYASSLYLNPAFAGMEQDLTFNANTRSQWASANGQNVTSQISVISPIITGIERKQLVGGVGMSIFNDVPMGGRLRRTGFRLSGAWSKGFNNNLHRISFGLQTGITQNSFDGVDAQWPTQYNAQVGYDPTVPVTLNGFDNVKYYVPINAGVMYSFNPSHNYFRAGTSWFSGLAVSNMNQPSQSFYTNGPTAKVPMVLKYHGGLEFNTTSDINFGPQLLIASMQGVSPQINVGAYMNYRLNDSPFGLLGSTDLVLGGWYRVQDAFIGMIGLSNNHYTVGFSYDATTSSMNQFNMGRGAYEISFAFRNAKDRKRRRFDTPRI